jgi:alpha-N-arabinofuranosidase
MRKLTWSVIVLTIVVYCLILTLSSCSFKNKAEEKQKSLSEKSGAFFDYFRYKGQDDFYKNNPLPGDNYFYNPFLPGWYSDPGICSNGEDFFLVTSSFSYFPGVPIFHSTDLVNWKQIGHVLNRKSQLELDGQRVSQGIFAPAITYNPYNQTYYMITTNIRKGNFFVKTKDPFGEWSEPVWLPNVHGIDPSFFFDDDGNAYIVNNGAPDGEALYNGHRAIRIYRFNVETEQTVGDSKVLVNAGVKPEEKPVWIEGPHMYKINGLYYLMAAEGGTGPNHCEVIFRGNSPMGVFKPWDKNPILTQRHLDPRRPLPISCAGHADLVKDKDGKWWSVFLACRPIDGEFENLGRETFIMPVRWSEDGFPYMTAGDELVPRILKKNGVKRSENVTFGNFEEHDDFDSVRLSDKWMTLRSPADDLLSLTENPGFLFLKFSDVKASERKTPAFVCQRIQHHKFECSTKLFFNLSEESDAAGLLLFKDETHQYFFEVRQNSDKLGVALKRIGIKGTEVLAVQFINNTKQPIVLKMVSRGKLWDFYYALGTHEPELLIADVDARYLSTANSYGFTGTTIGLYATKN